MIWNKTEKITNQHDIETPYFFIDEKELNSNVASLKNALNTHWNNYIIGYSFKTNSLPWLIDYFKNVGLYAEVVSDDEYQLASIIGYEKHKIIYNGPCKSKKTFIESIKNGCIVNIDSQKELCWLRELDNQKCEVGIRANFDIERYCPNESVMGAEGSRFGFCYENGELKKAIEYIGTLNNVSIKGIHLHCSTKTRSLNVYKMISKVACKVKRTYGLDLKYVDIGGGFYGGLKNKPTFSKYMDVISNELSKEFDKEKTTLIVEPGTSLVSSPFSFVTSVIDEKKTTLNNFVVTDGSRINIDPLMNKSKYFFTVEHGGQDKRPIIQKQVISGFTCMENDRLFTLENYPRLLIGDKIKYEKVGAYTMCLSPLFIKYYPAVYLKKDDIFLLIHDRWTAEDYLNKNSKRRGN